MGGRFRWDRRYLYWGITAFCVIAASILLFLGFSHWRSALALVKLVLGKLMPFIYGLIFAYLLNKPTMFFERTFFKKLRAKTPERLEKKRRALSVLLIMVITLLLIGGILASVLPQIYTSVENLVLELPAYFETTMDWMQRLFENMPELEKVTLGILGSVEESLTEWLRTKLLLQVNTILSGVTSGLIGALRALLNIVIGLVVAVYALYHKERFIAQVKKAIYVLIRPKRANKLLSGLNFLDFTCGSFITSTIIDSIIVGFVVLITMMIANMPYAVLIAVIIGITNLIPFFGPFIGAVPCALLVLLESPTKCIVFVILIIIIQQLDGNILFPRLQGSRQGLSGFWILFAILLFGGLFGFWGMLLGVPVFAVIYQAAKVYTKKRLASRGLPTETGAYAGEIVYSEPPETDDEQES